MCICAPVAVQRHRLHFVDEPARRLARALAFAVLEVRLALLHVLERELTDVELALLRKVVGEGRKVPGVDLKPPHLDRLDVLDLGAFLVLLLHFLVVRCARLQRVHVVDPPLHLARRSPPAELAAVMRPAAPSLVQHNAVRRHPLVQPPVDADVMDVVVPLPPRAHARARRWPPLDDLTGLRLPPAEAGRLGANLERLHLPSAAEERGRAIA